MHILFGILCIGILLFFWKIGDWKYSVPIFFLGFLISLFIIWLRFIKIRAPYDSLFETAGKRDRFPGEGALWYILGVLLLVSFLPRLSEIVASIYILAIGDGVSSIFSTWRNKRKKSFLKNKSLLSFTSFVIFSLPAIVFVGPTAFPIILLCALVESIDLWINDNFLIPLVCTSLFYLL